MCVWVGKTCTDRDTGGEAIGAENWIHRICRTKQDDRRKIEEVTRRDWNEETPENEGSWEQTAMRKAHSENGREEIDKESMKTEEDGRRKEEDQH